MFPILWHTCLCTHQSPFLQQWGMRAEKTSLVSEVLSDLNLHSPDEGWEWCLMTCPILLALHRIIAKYIRAIAWFSAMEGWKRGDSSWSTNQISLLFLGSFRPRQNFKLPELATITIVTSYSWIQESLWSAKHFICTISILFQSQTTSLLVLWSS